MSVAVDLYRDAVKGQQPKHMQIASTVDTAKQLVDTVYETCSVIDQENAERVSEALKNFDKSDLRPATTEEREW